MAEDWHWITLDSGCREARTDKGNAKRQKEQQTEEQNYRTAKMSSLDPLISMMRMIRDTVPPMSDISKFLLLLLSNIFEVNLLTFLFI